MKLNLIDRISPKYGLLFLPIILQRLIALLLHLCLAGKDVDGSLFRKLLEKQADGDLSY